MRRNLVRVVLGLLITLFFAGHAARSYHVGLITRLDDIIYDARLKLTMPRGVDTKVVILDIDEKSLGEVGHWPWRRDLMAGLMDTLFEHYGVAMVAFDVVWAERDASSGIDTLDAVAKGELKDVAAFQAAYRQLRPQLDFDGRFGAKVKGRPVVLGYYFNAEERAVRVNAIPEPVLPKGSFAGRDVRFPRWRGYTGNLPALQASAAGAGHFNPLPDDDGISRRVPMVLEFEGAYYESLSLAVLRALIAMQAGGVSPKVEPGPVDAPTLEWLKVGPLTIPVDERAAALIPYRGPKFSFPYVSLADVLRRRADTALLRGRIALVGSTAPGLFDLRATPVESVFPGVEIHANLVAGMLDGSIKQKPQWVVGAEALLLIVGGTLFSIVIPMLSAQLATAAAVVATALAAGFNFAVWTHGDTVLPLAASLLMVALIYTMNMAYGYFVESRTKRQVTAVFGQYVPPEIVEKIAQDPEKYSMEGKSQDLTVLFSDIVGFTHISESLEPKELAAFINEYLTSMSLVIREHGGTLDKYIGDAIMAFWGAPVDDTAHARNGIRAALHMQAELRRINAQVLGPKGWPEIRIGIGLNSGLMRVGDMGSRVRRAYTVMGDPVNLASRLEALTREYGVGILVGEATRDRTGDVVFREIDRVKVKGKDEPVAIFEPLGFEGRVAPELLAEAREWQQCLKQYRAQDWDAAAAGLSALERAHPDGGLYRAYARRVAAYRASPPPPGWDGVTRFTTK